MVFSVLTFYNVTYLNDPQRDCGLFGEETMGTRVVAQTGEEPTEHGESRAGLQGKEVGRREWAQPSNLPLPFCSSPSWTLRSSLSAYMLEEGVIPRC